MICHYKWWLGQRCGDPFNTKRWQHCWKDNLEGGRPWNADPQFYSSPPPTFSFIPPFLQHPLTQQHWSFRLSNFQAKKNLRKMANWSGLSEPECQFLSWLKGNTWRVDFIISHGGRQSIHYLLLPPLQYCYQAGKRALSNGESRKSITAAVRYSILLPKAPVAPHVVVNRSRLRVDGGKFPTDSTPGIVLQRGSCNGSKTWPAK